MSERRYFNLGPVVRDLEHGSGQEATAEGRDLWARFCDLVWEAYSVAAALDADDGTEDEDEPDHLDGDEMGDAVQQRSSSAGRGPGRADASRDDVLTRLARLEGALATEQGPKVRVACGAPALDGTRRDTAVTETRAVIGGNRATPRKKVTRSGKKHARKRTKTPAS